MNPQLIKKNEEYYNHSGCLTDGEDNESEETKDEE